MFSLNRNQGNQIGLQIGVSKYSSIVNLHISTQLSNVTTLVINYFQKMFVEVALESRRMKKTLVASVDTKLETILEYEQRLSNM